MAKKNTQPSADMPPGKAQSLWRLREGLLLLLAALALFFLFSLLSYHTTDPGWSFSGDSEKIHNLAGRWGAWSADFLFSWLGFLAYLLPFLLAYLVPVLYRERNPENRHLWLSLLRWVGAILIFFSGTALSQLCLSTFSNQLPQGAGGIIGNAIATTVLPELSFTGSMILLWALFLLGLTWFCGVHWARVFKLLFSALRRGATGVGGSAFAITRQFAARRTDPVDTADAPHTEIPQEPTLAVPPPQKPIIHEPHTLDTAPLTTETPKAPALEPAVAALPIATQKRAPFKGKVPSLQLLDKPEPPKNKASKATLEETARLLETKLSDFGVVAHVTGICPGPIVTRYELDLAPGVKVSKLSGLSKDLARALSAFSVRVVEVIPGKAVVGIEIPNDNRDIVRLREVLDTPAFLNAHAPLTFALGKDIAGKPELADLSKMPHLLVAGTTGSGKSVGLNAMLLSFLLKGTPDDIRLIMIDPKMLELSIYEGIPHLLTPVVTDMKQAANALLWCVKEMDRRYRVMATLGVRNIASMNEKVAQAKAAGNPLLDPLWQRNHPDSEDPAPELEALPYIVVLVDEFADMIMVVGKKVEELIARLAQKARAAGIHLILATQRPSVDVITGLIKANIPTRIAFQVSSKIDSRTILDQQGAEQLLGYGDMLYLPPGTGVPIRVHGAYVSDQEVHRVVSAWKALGAPEYCTEVLEHKADAEEDAEDLDAESDPLYDQAVQIVLETQRASISGVQRRLKIGYNRAARLLEAMEKAGLVSEIQSNGLREILAPQAPIEST